jgi:hypothetical protein
VKICVGMDRLGVGYDRCQGGRLSAGILGLLDEERVEML